MTTRWDALLQTVENTVSIACFVKEGARGREVVSGVRSNEAVAGVRIRADGQTLYEQIRPGAAVSAAGEMLPISLLIHSPFDKHQEVGEIVLFASQATLHELAWSYGRYVLFVLGLEVALMSLAVAWVVYNLITRPIKSISDELHRLELRTGMRLRVPRRNKQDELGRLVCAVTAMIERKTVV